MDELNVFSSEYVYDFEKYYESMDISKEQKEKRTETANDLWYVFLFLFAMLKEAIEDGGLDYAFILSMFQTQFSDAVTKYSDMDDYIREYISDFTQNTMDVTWEHTDFTDPNSYWLSDERASLLALNESNTVNNYSELKKAIKEGYTHKTWKAEIDRRTRKDHVSMDGKTIEIDKYFEFPDCRMIAPHDMLNGTDKELCNCRCSLEYIKK